MNVRIEKKNSFKLIGYEMKNIKGIEAPQAWEHLFEHYSYEELEELGSGISYGVCFEYGDAEEGNINYLAGYDIKDVEKAKKYNDLVLMEFPEEEYAVFELRGPVPQCIHEGLKYAINVFMREKGYRHSGKPDFEVYSKGNMDSEDYEMELWIPIVSNK